MTVVLFDQGARVRVVQEMGGGEPDLSAPVDVYGLSELERPTVGVAAEAAGATEHPPEDLVALSNAAAGVGVRAQVKAA